jgi:hypothetical protein
VQSWAGRGRPREKFHGDGGWDKNCSRNQSPSILSKIFHPILTGLYISTNIVEIINVLCLLFMSIVFHINLQRSICASGSIYIAGRNILLLHPGRSRTHHPCSPLQDATLSMAIPFLDLFDRARLFIEAILFCHEISNFNGKPCYR